MNDPNPTFVPQHVPETDMPTASIGVRLGLAASAVEESAYGLAGRGREDLVTELFLIAERIERIARRLGGSSDQ